MLTARRGQDEGLAENLAEICRNREKNDQISA
jgi:hypothetical protein